jgi:hypothetical protein
MSVDVMQEKIDDLDRQIKDLCAHRKQLIDSILEQQSPYKIGDILEKKDGARGVVKKIEHWQNDRPVKPKSWVCQKLKKDGTLSAYEMTFWRDDTVKVVGKTNKD